MRRPSPTSHPLYGRIGRETQVGNGPSRGVLSAPAMLFRLAAGSSLVGLSAIRHGPPARADWQVSKNERLRAGAVRLQPEGLIEGWRERRSGSMLVDDEEPEGPSRTVLLGEQATRTCQSSAQAGLTAVRPAWGCGQARRAAWASCQGVARSPARPCSAPATYDASRARPSGKRTDTRYSLAWMGCQEQSENMR